MATTKYWISTSSTDFLTAANYSDGVVPGNDDTVIFSGLGTASATTNLTWTGTGNLTLIVENSYAGYIGSVTAGAATGLKPATATTFTAWVGQESGGSSTTGSARLLFDNNSITSTLNIFDSASTGAESFYPPVLLKGSWTVNCKGGNWGFNARPGESGTLTAASLTSEGEPNVAPACFIGQGATVTRLDASAGAIYSRSSNTTALLNLLGSSCKYLYEGSGQHTAATIGKDSTVLDKGSGNWPTMSLVGKYLRRNTSAITVGGTAFNAFPGGVYDIRNGKTGTTTTSNKTMGQASLGVDFTVITNAGENW